MPFHLLCKKSDLQGLAADDAGREGLDDHLAVEGGAGRVVSQVHGRLGAGLAWAVSRRRKHTGTHTYKHTLALLPSVRRRVFCVGGRQAKPSDSESGAADIARVGSAANLAMPLNGAGPGWAKARKIAEAGRLTPAHYTATVRPCRYGSSVMQRAPAPRPGVEQNGS